MAHTCARRDYFGFVCQSSVAFDAVDIPVFVVLFRVQVPYTVDHVDTLFKAVDTSGDGLISYPEFEVFYLEYSKVPVFRHRPSGARFL